VSGNRCNGTTALPLEMVTGLRNGFSSITQKELEGCYFVILQSDSLLGGRITVVHRQVVFIVVNTLRRVRHGSWEMGKGRLAYFHQNIAWLSLCWKNIFFCFSYFEPCGYDNFPNEGTVKFWHGWGHFPISPKIGDAAKNPVTGYWNYTIPQLFVTIHMSHSFALMRFKG